MFLAFDTSKPCLLLGPFLERLMPRLDRWRNIAIALIDQRSKRVIAFHEKAGRSQVVSLSFLFVTRFFSAELPTVATLPSALFDERVFSLGASWVFSFQPVLPPDCRPPVPSEMEVGPGD